jgi:hypothetical protein
VQSGCDNYEANTNTLDQPCQHIMVCDLVHC